MPRFFSHAGCTEGDIRLLEGSTRQEGRVEICKNNAWGTVCHSGWSIADARVVCRQLGYSVVGKGFSQRLYSTFIMQYNTGSTFPISSFYGPGTGPIVLSSVAFTGIEGRLIDCPSSAPYRCTGVGCMLATGELMRDQQSKFYSLDLSIWYVCMLKMTVVTERFD